MTIDRPDGTRSVLNPRLELANHNPTGFEWGYGGSGPAQLALALLADACGNDETALAYYQDIKRPLVARLPREGFTLTAGETSAPSSATAGAASRPAARRRPTAPS